MHVRSSAIELTAIQRAIPHARCSALRVAVQPAPVPTQWLDRLLS